MKYTLNHREINAEIRRGRYLVATVWDDSKNPTMTGVAKNVHLLASSDEMKDFIKLIARMNYDGEEMNDGEIFILENDDAVNTCNELINSARHLIEMLKL